ncbi:MAG: SDR family NAD(P)-dependent oxidoreductase [Magnetococcus sp. THC-1_WYH]
MIQKIDRSYADIEIGDRVCFTRRFPLESFHDFYKLSKDNNPLHHDAHYASATPYQRPILPVLLTSLPLSAIAGTVLPGHRSLFINFQIHAVHPAYYDQEISYSAKVIKKNDLFQTITLRTLVFHHSQILLEAEQIIQVRDDVPENLAPARDHDIPILRNTPRTVLITGARGAIGSAIAVNLARNGFNLLLTFRPGACEPDEHLLSRCRGYGVHVACMAADLEGDADGLVPLIETMTHDNLITDLVHVASPPVHASAHALFNVNYLALKILSEALIPQILQRQEGHVLMLGSSAVQSTPQGWEDYATAKAAASHYITGLNTRFGHYGLTGWVLAPGMVATQFSAKFRTPATLSLQPEQVAESASALLKGQYGTQGGYFWLEPQTPERLGRFGFYASEVRSSLEPDRSAHSSSSVEAVQGADIDGLFRQFFKLAPSDDIALARVGESPYWDSLRHIEFMLFLEKNMGLTFSSKDIDRTKRYLDLVSLIAEKRKSES